MNPWRIFSANDESGTVICDYSEGVEKPETPIPYCQETMTGFEYAFAGLLFARDRADDGVKVVEAVRNRFDGEKRNPWNEFECGSNYARSMASNALIPILSGFEFYMPNKYIGFNPYIKKDFKCVWSIDGGWGVLEIKGDKINLKILGGSITLKSLGLKLCNCVSSLKIDGKSTDFRFNQGILYFDETNITREMEITL